MKSSTQTPTVFQRPSVAGTQTLERAMTVLRAVAGHGDHGANVDQLRTATGLSRATLYRLLLSLRRQGLLRQPHSRGPYYLGYELVALGARAGNSGGLRELARPALLQLTEDLGESFFLLIPDGYYALCLEMQDGDHPVRCFSRSIGGRILMGVGQATLALLAWFDRSEREAILSHNGPRLKREYALEIQQVRRHLPQVRHRGFACSAGGNGLMGYTGVSVPILDGQSKPVGALSCGLEASRMTPVYQNTLVNALQRHVQDIVERANGLIRIS